MLFTTISEAAYEADLIRSATHHISFQTAFSRCAESTGALHSMPSNGHPRYDTFAAMAGR